MSDLRERLQSGLADRYQLERELGRGGMATVFLATDIDPLRSNLRFQRLAKGAP